MPKRSSKSSDLNKRAFQVVEEATSEDQDPYEGKDPAAVELGRKGGLKGGPARAKKLSAERRSEVAKKAALARWKRDKTD